MRTNRAMRTLAVLLAALAHTLPSAHGHPVHVQSGVVTLTEDRVEVRFTIDARKLAHPGMTALTVADELQRSLRVFDEYGAPLVLDDVRQVDADQSDVTTLHLTYAPDERCHYVTFQQRLPADAMMHRRQLQLTIVRSDEGTPTGRRIRLSSAGNAVTIGRHPADSRTDLGDIDPFCDPVLLLRPAAPNGQLELHLPASLVETWLPIERTQRDVITADEFDTLVPKLRRWFAQQFSSAARDDAMSIRSVRLLRPGDTLNGIVDRGSHRTGNVGFWCARIAIAADIQNPSEQPAELRCELFNSAVLSLPVLVFDENMDVAGRRTVSTYSPTIRLDRSIGNPPATQ